METKHTEELFAAGGSLDIWTYMPMVVQTFRDMERLVNDALKEREQGTQFPFVIFDKDASKLVGSTRFLDISATNRSLEIGWTWLSPSVWRTKVNTECKYLLFKHYFETLGTIRVQLKTDSRNLRSQKAIERLGGVKERVIRNHRILSDGYRRHSVYYSVIDEEWLGSKKNWKVSWTNEVTPPELNVSKMGPVPYRACPHYSAQGRETTRVPISRLVYYDTKRKHCRSYAFGGETPIVIEKPVCMIIQVPVERGPAVSGRFATE